MSPETIAEKLNEVMDSQKALENLTHVGIPEDLIDYLFSLLGNKSRLVSGEISFLGENKPVTIVSWKGSKEKNYTGVVYTINTKWVEEEAVTSVGIALIGQNGKARIKTFGVGSREQIRWGVFDSKLITTLFLSGEPVQPKLV